eukprot:gb/GEZN01006443.1/.p1 GENE.gb/GEZN01006443.1/~~gb/GEZN01006443.1/.p1  ORF type:complete len:482 (-),score=75.71 gb/GEZN01006443.1/:127-1572(-)
MSTTKSEMLLTQSDKEISSPLKESSEPPETAKEISQEKSSKTEIEVPTEEREIPRHTSKWDEEKKTKFAYYFEEDELRRKGLMNNNDRALLIGTDKSQNFAQVGPKKKVKLEKNWVNLNALLGQPYGSKYEVARGALQRTAQKQSGKTAYTDPNFAPSANNSSIFDDGTSQKLTHSEIEDLKKTTKGDELIALITSSSETFDNKTEFSKEKYIKRKKSKYMKEYMVVRPSLDNIAAHFLATNQAPKTGYLRVDTLSQLLTAANIMPGAKTLVIETCGGLLTTAIGERQGGFGYVLSAFHGKHGNQAVSGNYKSSRQVQESIKCFPLTIIKEAVFNCNQLKKGVPVPVQETSGADNDGPAIQRMQNVMNLLVSQVDSLVIASRFDIMTMVKAVWDLLAPSASFAIHSRTLQPLAQCFELLKVSKPAAPGSSGPPPQPYMAVNMHLTETWYRPYQVLPARTHPHMFMTASGGYVLSGTKVAEA